MIRRLTEKDHEKTMNLLNEKPAENLFILGDIEAFGYEQDFQTLWGDFSNSGDLRAVMLKYQQNFIPYASGPFDTEGFANVINNHPEFHELSGLNRITEQIEPHIQHHLQKKRTLHYAKCDSKANLGEPTNLKNVQQATLEDTDRIVHLYSQIEEFVTNQSSEQMKRNMEQGVQRTYFIEDQATMISAASTAAENSRSAMIVGVCTLPSYKRKGYASQCMAKLCHDVLSEGKELCLFYDNPDAGKIYQRIGFEEIDQWMIHLY